MTATRWRPAITAHLATSGSGPAGPRVRPTPTATVDPDATVEVARPAPVPRPAARKKRKPTKPTAPSPAVTTSSPPAPRHRIDGLDGLRAIAVIGVLLYHADVPWALGGFIGVDIFFVLSGYLVTGIVLAGIERTGGLGFGRFWSGRLRRLAPAQLAMIAVVTLAVALWHFDELVDLRGQVVAALTGTTNWYLIVTEGSYFEQLGRPPVLRHLWSLAIELQFYLVFPLVLLAMMRRWSQRLDRIVTILLVATLVSTLYLAFLYEPGGDPSRAYFDTFGRLAAPLLGAVLALVWRPGALRRGPAVNLGRPIAAAGAISLVLLIWLMNLADDRGAAMYRGGFLAVALLSAVVVAAVVHPRSWLGSRAALASPVLVTIGLRSYGLYLWHWPVYVLLRPGVDVGWSWGVTFWVRIIVTIFLAETCYRLVEKPWHLRAPSASLAGIKRNILQPAGITTGARLAAWGGVLLIVVATAILIPSRPANDEIADSLAAGQEAVEQSSGRPGVTLAPGATTTTTTVDGEPADPADVPLVPDDGRVTMVGDSVMLGAAPALVEQFGTDAIIDASVGRQAAELGPVLTQLGVEGRLGATVVVQVGINGTVTEDDLRAVAAAVPGRRLLIINSRVPRTWQDGNNAMVRTVVPTLPNAAVIDWFEESADHGDWYLDDGVHLDEDGRAAYAAAISKAVEEIRADESD